MRSVLYMVITYYWICNIHSDWSIAIGQFYTIPGCDLLMPTMVPDSIIPREVHCEGCII